MSLLKQEHMQGKFVLLFEQVKNLLFGLAGRAYTRRGWQFGLGGEQLHPG